MLRNAQLVFPDQQHSNKCQLSPPMLNPNPLNWIALEWHLEDILFFNTSFVVFPSQLDAIRNSILHPMHCEKHWPIRSTTLNAANTQIWGLGLQPYEGDDDLAPCSPGLSWVKCRVLNRNWDKSAAQFHAQWVRQIPGWRHLIAQKKLLPTMKRTSTNPETSFV